MKRVVVIVRRVVETKFDLDQVDVAPHMPQTSLELSTHLKHF